VPSKAGLQVQSLVRGAKNLPALWPKIQNVKKKKSHTVTNSRKTKNGPHQKIFKKMYKYALFAY